MTQNDLENRINEVAVFQKGKRKESRFLKAEYLSPMFLTLAFLLVFLQLFLIMEKVSVVDSPTVLAVKTDKQLYIGDDNVTLFMDSKRSTTLKVPVDVKCSILDLDTNRFTPETAMYSFTLEKKEETISMMLHSSRFRTGNYKVVGWLFEYDKFRRTPIPFATNEFRVQAH